MMDKLKEMLGSRKVLLLILGVIYALLTVFKEQVGFSLDPESVVTTLAVICVYIFGEARADMARIMKSMGPGSKWKEPQFWLSLIGSFLPVIAAIGIKIPVGTINTLLALIIGIIFKKKSTG